MLTKSSLLPVLLLVWLASNSLPAQDIRIVYEIRQDPAHGLSYEELNPIPDFSMLARRYTLTLSGATSRFTHDSLMLSYVSKTGNYTGRYTKVASYKNLSDNTFLYVNGRMKKDHGITGKLNVIGQERTCLFKFEPEYRVIAGFKCQKTVDCDGEEAWVATDIPYVDSPTQEGIPAPGLVLLYRNDDYEIKAIDVSTGNYKFEIPKLNLVDGTNESDIYLTVQEQIDIGADKATIINKQSPTDVWLKLPQ